MSPPIWPTVVIAGLTAAAGNAGAVEFTVRPGGKQAKLMQPPSNDSRHTYKMVSVIKGKAGNRFLIDRRLDRSYADQTLYWKERYTIVTAAPDRDGLAKYLGQANYAEAWTTADGVRFLIEVESDE